MANYPKNISSTTPLISPPALDGSGDNGNQGGDICPSSRPVAPQREVEIALKNHVAEMTEAVAEILLSI
jgi:hypothetical protein